MKDLFFHVRTHNTTIEYIEQAFNIPHLSQLCPLIFQKGSIVHYTPMENFTVLRNQFKIANSNEAQNPSFARDELMHDETMTKKLSLSWEEDDSDTSSEDTFTGSEDSYISSESSSDSLSSRVSWSPTLVDEVYTRPRLNDNEKDALFYNYFDYMRFRQAYKEHLIQEGTNQMRKNTNDEEKEPADETSSKEKYDYYITLFTQLISAANEYLFSEFPSHQVPHENKKAISHSADTDTEVLMEVLFFF